MKIVAKKSVAKDLKKIPDPQKTNIKKKIEGLKAFPSIPSIKKLTNFTPSYRLRVGDYRVLFEVNGDTIEVYAVKHRKESY